MTVRGVVGLALAWAGVVMIGLLLSWWVGLGVVLVVLGWAEWKGHRL